MTKVVLIRHGRSTANAAGVLAGRAEGVALDDIGRAQAAALRDLLTGSAISAAYTSPIQRCRETAELAGFPGAEVIDALSECDYGQWTGQRLQDLSSGPVWTQIQSRPSLVSFPGGESMHEMFLRSTRAVARLAARHSATDSIVVFSHGDPIKAILAHALAIDFDEFQRVHVNPAGISIVEYLPEQVRVLCINAGSDIAGLLATRQPPAVGGGDIATPA